MCQSSNDTDVNIFTETKYNYVPNVKEYKDSNFDIVLKKKWKEAQEKGIFRYILNISESKILDGKYHFLAQLNIDRGYKRRAPDNIALMTQPFDDTRFNFTKLAPEEEIMDLSNGDEENIIAINVSPFEYCHSLLLPQRCKKLPQVVTKYSLYKATELFSLSCSLDLRVGFNSLCGHASVNHLHWHLYYLNCRMLLEHIDLEEYAGPVKILRDYAAKGYCIKYSDVQTIDNFVTWAFLVINYLQGLGIAHNVYITRAKSNSEEYGDLRIYIWARKSSKDAKDTSALIPAVCEFFGHVSIKCEEVYKTLTEEYVARILEDTTEQSFVSVFDELKELILKQITVPEK